MISGRTTLAAVLAGAALCAPAWAEVTADVRATFQFDTVALASSNLPPGARMATGGSFRRLRLGLDGSLAEDWDYGFTARLETASLHHLQITNAFVQHDGLAPFHFKLGIFSPPENFEDGTSSSEVMFLERAQPADLARSLGGGTGRWAATVFRYDDSSFAALSLAGGVGSDTLLRQQSLIGRLAWRPWHDGDSSLALGADFTFLFAPPQGGLAREVALRARPEMNEQPVDLRLIDTGAMDADRAGEFGLEAAGNAGNLYAQAGLFHFAVDRAPLSDPVFHGWYLQGSWIITGEARQYHAGKGAFGVPLPQNPLASGGAGAFELAARYSELDLDHDAGLPGTVAAPGAIRGGRQRITTLGLNWYPGDPVRLLLDYQHVAVSRLGATGSDLDAAADLLCLRTQIAF